MKKQTGRIALMSVLVLGILFQSGCRSMFAKKETKPQYVCYDLSVTNNAVPNYKVNDKNNPVEVIMFAKSLSVAGKYKDSASIYLDAAERFTSKSGHFEFDCRMAAVRELWLSGNLKGAAKQLTELENYQDIYLKASEEKSISELRRLLKESNVIKDKAVVKLNNNNTSIEIGE